MNPVPTFDASPPLALREACSNLARHLRTLGYPHADHTTCEGMLRAFFPYPPELYEGSPDLKAGVAFLERFVHECAQRRQDTGTRGRRCYGQAVEEAVTVAESRGEQAHRAPRLTELMTQLDADGHNTTQLRLELEHLIDELGMRQFYG